MPKPSRDGEAWGAFMLHLGIDGTGLEPVHPFHQVVDAAPGSLEDGGNAFVSIFPGRHGRSRDWSVSVYTHTPAMGWTGGGDEEARRRVLLEERLIDAARVS